jgi:hypothetical protein
MNAMLKEFDSADPLDLCLGSKKELKQNRNLVSSFCQGVDNNPFLSPIGRFLLKKLALNMLKNRKIVLQSECVNGNETFRKHIFQTE